MSRFSDLDIAIQRGEALDPPNPCDGCAIIIGDDPCTVCRYQTAEVAAAIDRRYNE